MKILVKERDRTVVRLGLPTGLVCNRLALGILGRELEKRNIPLSACQLSMFLRAVKVYKKTHPDWVLVEVEAADGTFVQIKP